MLGRSQRTIGAQFGVSRDSIARHSQRHLSPALKRAATRHETGGPRRAVDRLEDLYARCTRILDAAEAAGNPGLALNAAKELRATVEVLAKISGELDERPQIAVVNVLNSSEWGQIRAALMVALASHPDASRAVSAALLAIEQ